MAEDKSDEWFAKHNKQKAAAWDGEDCLEICPPFLSQLFVW